MARLQEEGDFARSFGVLADNLKRLLLRPAYQSLLFNRMLSQSVGAGLPWGGRWRRTSSASRRTASPGNKLQAVDGSNVSAVNRLAERGRAFVTLPSSDMGRDLPGPPR